MISLRNGNLNIKLIFKDDKINRKIKDLALNKESHKPPPQASSPCDIHNKYNKGSIRSPNTKCIYTTSGIRLVLAHKSHNL